MFYKKLRVNFISGSVTRRFLLIIQRIGMFSRTNPNVRILKTNIARQSVLEFVVADLKTTSTVLAMVHSSSDLKMFLVPAKKYKVTFVLDA